MFSTAQHRFERVTTDQIRDSRLWLLVFAPVALLYLVSAHWTLNNADSIAAAWPAWALVHHGTLHLEHIANLPINPWFLHGAHGHIVSSRMPGVSLISVPMQALFAWTRLDPMAPSVATASIVAAAAAANMTLVFRRTSPANVALIGGLVLAAGTCLWTVAGAELWAHGPDALWLSALLLAITRERYWLAGLFGAGAALTRPHLVVAVALIGIALAVGRRTPRPVIALGLPAGLGLVGVVAYNWYLFGTASLDAGSYSYAGKTVISGTGTTFVGSLYAWADSAVGMLISPSRGLLAYSPILLVALLALRSSWRELPDWAKGATVGGLAYFLVQAHINGYEGGSGYYGSRLTIGPMLLWSPLVFVAARKVWSRGYGLVVYLLAAVSVATQLTGAAFGRVITVLRTVDLNRSWMPYEVAKTGGVRAGVLAFLMLSLIGLAAVHLFSSKSRWSLEVSVHDHFSEQSVKASRSDGMNMESGI